MAGKTRMTVALGLAVAVLATLLAGAWVLGGTAGPAEAQQSVTVTLGAGRDGSQPGTAVLTAQGNQTQVVIDMQAVAAGVDQPVHIHEGSCPGVGAVKFPLTNVVDGKSTTAVDARLADLQTGNLSINVHKSQAEISIYVACGAIPAAAAAPAPAAQPAAPAAPPVTGSGGLLVDDGSSVSGWWYALAASGALLTVGGLFALRMGRRRS